MDEPLPPARVSRFRRDADLEVPWNGWDVPSAVADEPPGIWPKPKMLLNGRVARSLSESSLRIRAPFTADRHAGDLSHEECEAARLLGMSLESYAKWSAARTLAEMEEAASFDQRIRERPSTREDSSDRKPRDRRQCAFCKRFLSASQWIEHSCISQAFGRRGADGWYSITAVELVREFSETQGRTSRTYSYVRRQDLSWQHRAELDARGWWRGLPEGMLDQALRERPRLTEDERLILEAIERAGARGGSENNGRHRTPLTRSAAFSHYGMRDGAGNWRGASAKDRSRDFTERMFDHQRWTPLSLDDLVVRDFLMQGGWIPQKAGTTGNPIGRQRTGRGWRDANDLVPEIVRRADGVSLDRMRAALGRGRTSDTRARDIAHEIISNLVAEKANVSALATVFDVTPKTIYRIAGKGNDTKLP